MKPLQSDRPVVVALSQTCGACPSQWEGETRDGRAVYIRYRWGTLTAGMGDSIDEAVGDDRFFAKQVGDGLDGTISQASMIRHLSSVLDFDDQMWALRGVA